MLENTDQNNPEYGQFLRIGSRHVPWLFYWIFDINFVNNYRPLLMEQCVWTQIIVIRKEQIVWSTRCFVDVFTWNWTFKWWWQYRKYIKTAKMVACSEDFLCGDDFDAVLSFFPFLSLWWKHFWGRKGSLYKKKITNAPWEL